jgi:hypothetical protein
MEGRNFAFLFEFFVFSGPAVAWGLWELRSLRRERRKDAEADAKQALRASGHTEG